MTANSPSITIEVAKDARRRGLPIALDGVASPARDDSDLWVEPRVVSASAEQPVPALAALFDENHSLLTGEPGSGKTALLTRYATSAAEDLLDGKSDCAVLLVSALELAEIRSENVHISVPGALAIVAERRVKQSVDLNDLAQELRAARLRAAVDGLDELLSAVERDSLAEWLASAHACGEIAASVISSRRLGIPSVLRDLHQLRLLPLNHQGLQQLVQAQWRPERPLPAPDVELIASISAGSPLLATILARVAGHTGRLPALRSGLYRSVVDVSLSLLADRAGIYSTTSLGVEAARTALKAIALGAFRAEASAFTVPQALEWVGSAVDVDAAERLVWLIIERSLVLVSRSPGKLSFVHVTLWHALVAEAVADDEPALDGLISRSQSNDVLVLAAGMAMSVSPVVALIVRRAGTDVLRAAWPEIAARGSGAVREALAIITSELSEIIGHQLVTTTPVHDPAKRRRTLALRQALEASGQRPETKGRAFEEFVVSLLGEALTIVRHDLRSALGQIDIVVTTEHPDPFWVPHGSDFYVECKFERGAATIEQVNTFIGKLQGRNRRLGFLISMSGFTDQARRRIEIQAYDPAAALIVPIHRQQIDASLSSGATADSLLKSRVRDVASLRRI